MKDPEKKKVIVTGGSGGIGSAICQRLMQEGYYIFNIDRAEPEHFINQAFFPADLLDLEKIKRIVQSIKKEEGIIGLVHCAGFGGPFHPITEVKEEEWDEIFTINIKSAYIILSLLLDDWKTSEFGRFIGIASSLSLVGARNSVAYSASKHALVGFVKSLADEWGNFGITSNAISPGYVRTSMGVQEDSVPDHLNQIIQKTPVRRIAEPFEIARVVSFLISHESGYINGSNWTIDGGITAI